MSVERAIHERWAGHLPLTALAPAERLFTGGKLGTPILPYVVLTRESAAPLCRASGGMEYIHTTVRFRVFDVELDRAKQIKEQIVARYNRQGFALTDGTCLNMQWTQDAETLHGDGLWQASVDFLVTSQHVSA